MVNILNGCSAAKLGTTYPYQVFNFQKKPKKP